MRYLVYQFVPATEKGCCVYSSRPIYLLFASHIYLCTMHVEPCSLHRFSFPNTCRINQCGFILGTRFADLYYRTWLCSCIQPFSDRLCQAITFATMNIYVLCLSRRVFRIADRVCGTVW